MFRLYRVPQDGELTVIGGDPSEGGDDCAAVAKSKKHLDSFLVYQEKTDSAQFGYDLHKMAHYIQKRTSEWPVILIERNVGMATIHVLQLLNYPRLFRMPQMGMLDKEESDKIGWVTNVATRQKMLDDLAQSLSQKVNTITDAETIRQLGSFIRSGTGKPQAAAGTNDDLVFAEAIAWQGLQLATIARTQSLAVAAQKFLPQPSFDAYGNPT